MPRDDRATAVLDVEPMTTRTPVVSSPEDPFNILVLGAFSGAASKDGGAPIEIDRDNFDQVVARFAPELGLTGIPSEKPGRSLRLEFHELDDFQPDALYRRVALFKDIERAVSARPPRAQAAGSEASAGLLDRIISDMPEAETRRPANGHREPSVEDANDLRAFIDRVLSSYLVPGESPEQISTRERTRAIASGLMRGILHAPEFQKLEAAWRGAQFLVRRIETGPKLKIFIADRGASENIPAAPRDLRWSVIVLDRSFGRSEENMTVLGKFAIQAMALNAAILAEAEPPGGDPDEGARWQQFRHRPETAHVGLALPRLIARMPYGESGETTDEFRFEEFDSTPRHADYLWMNPAFGLAYLLAAAFEHDGWRMVTGSVRDIERLPLHVYQEAGESVAKPCAEILIRETDVEQLLDEGIMPFASIRDTDRVRLVRFQSIAEPLLPLAGPWD